MTFTDLPYGLFLLIVLAVYWLVGSRAWTRKAALQDGTKPERDGCADLAVRATSTARLWILLAFGLLFYGLLLIEIETTAAIETTIIYVAILLLISYVNFRLAIAMEAQAKGSIQTQYAQLSNQEWEQVQQVWNQRTVKLLTIGIAINVVLLVGFKYIPFLLNSIAAILNLPLASQSATWVGDRLIAPLGFSFFTFECIAYLVDVYRGAPATRNFLKFSSYKLFFPKLIAGPITRYHYFANQFKEQKILSLNRCISGLWLIANGAIKKALIADNLGIFVDLCFGNLERAGSEDLWLAIFLYGLQLYFDFSGYVDIARGSATLLGFDLPENFDAPYFTTSIADFWRRWHISLGDWLRNYLYFPLGGSRYGLRRTCINLFLVMLIAGIWHGAAWGYVIWGIFHGVALVVHRLTDSLSKQIEELAAFWASLPGTILAWLITQFAVFFSWIFFRLPNLQQSSLVLQHLWNYPGDIQFTLKVYGETLEMERISVFGLAIALSMLMSVVSLFQRGLKLQLNWPVKMLLTAVCLYAVWILAPDGVQYIYFDF